MAMRNRDKWLPVRILMLAFAACLLFHFRAAIPLGALSADASVPSAVVGMIGKATNVQGKVEKVLKPAEEAGSIDAETAATLSAELVESSNSLTLAWNLMQAAPAGQATLGWYYARIRAQSDLTTRLNQLLASTGQSAPEPVAAEEGPAEASQ